MERKTVKMGILLTVLLIAILVSTVNIQPVKASEDGLVGYWAFDEGTGIIVQDNSGNGNHGIIYGASWVDGIYGSALDFDGINDYVEIPFSPSLSLSTWTLIAFCKPEAGQTPYSRLISVGISQNAINLGIYEPGKPFGHFANGGSIYSPENFQPHTWQTWSFSYNGSMMALYRDGTLMKTESITATVISYSSAIRIGSRVSPAEESFNGVIDEVKVYDRALSEEEIRTLANVGLAGYWDFNEGGGTVAYDSSGNGNNGTIYGAIWTEGKAGSALSFDGIDDYVEVPDDLSLELTTGLTVAAWVKVNGVTGHYQVVVAKWYPDAVSYILEFQPDGKTPWLVLTTPGRTNTASNSSIQFGVWTHIAATYDGSVAKIYINGVLTGSQAVSGLISVGNQLLTIGSHSPSAPEDWNWFNGVIDEVKVYDRALSEEEIRTLANVGLAGYWDFNEGGGTVAYDSSGNGNNGTIYGATWTNGKIGNGLNFTKLSDYVEVNDSASLDLTSQLTIMAWIKPNILPSYWPRIVEKGGHGPYAYELMITTGGAVLALENGAGYCETYCGHPVNEWVHFAGTWNGTSMKIYKNGLLKATSSFSGSLTPTEDPLLIGGPGGYNDYFKGIIDEVKIYNRALSAEEIRIIMEAHGVAVTNITPCKTVINQNYTENVNVSVTVENQGSFPETFDVSLFTEPTGLVGYWTFDEGEGTMAYDSSGNNNNGILINGPQWIEGKIGTALSFDGTDDYVDVAASDSLYNLSSMTIEAWIYPKSGGGDKIVIDRGFYQPPYWTFSLLNALGGMRWNTGCTTNDQGILQDATNIPYDTWTHIVLVAFRKDSTFHNATWYINGQKTSSSIVPTSLNCITSTSNRLLIGQSSHPIYHFNFNGTIDEVKIFNRALTSEEVWTEYTQAPIAIQTVTLERGKSTSLTFIWNTTGLPKGNYTIWAYATRVSDEIDVTDNTFVYAYIVTITIPGDVDGDGKVGILDVVLITAIYGSKRGDPDFQANSDLLEDGKIDIVDVVRCTSQYGQPYP